MIATCRFVGDVVEEIVREQNYSAVVQGCYCNRCPARHFHSRGHHTSWKGEGLYGNTISKEGGIHKLVGSQEVFVFVQVRFQLVKTNEVRTDRQTDRL